MKNTETVYKVESKNNGGIKYVIGSEIDLICEYMRIQSRTYLIDHYIGKRIKRFSVPHEFLKEQIAICGLEENGSLSRDNLNRIMEKFEKQNT